MAQTNSDSDSVITDPAAHIARNWYRGMELEYGGVDFGKCVEYDLLQILNRAIITLREQKKNAGTK